MKSIRASKYFEYDGLLSRVLLRDGKERTAVSLAIEVAHTIETGAVYFVYVQCNIVHGVPDGSYCSITAF